MKSRVRSLEILSLALLLTLGFGMCRRPLTGGEERGIRNQLDSAERMVALFHYDNAVRRGLAALAQAEAYSGADAVQLACEAHAFLARVYLLALQDSLSWEHACLAERQATAIQNDSLLATALLQKGQICSYVGISPETARDDEALGYTMRALALADSAGYTKIETDACYRLSELYVNKNRWNEVWQPEFYEQAGAWLARAEAMDPEAPSMQSMKYRFRYLRQDGYMDEAIAYCLRMLEIADPDDHRIRYHIHNHLTTMYLRLGDIDKATEAFRSYTREMRKYIRQKEDLTMQELQLQYDTSRKDRQIQDRTAVIALLGALLSVALAAILLTIRLNRKITRQNEKIRNVSRSRELLLGTLAQEMKDPEMEGLRDPGVLDFFRQWSTMDEAEIVRKSAELTAGNDALDPTVARYVANLMLARKKALDKLGLTDRELEIIALSKKGLTDRQISDRLCLSTRTVSNHKYHIYGKLDVKNNAEMLSKAQELGL